MWNMKRDMWHVTHDTWHKTHALKIAALELFRFGIDSVWNIFEVKDCLINQWTEVIVEQPRLHWVC